MESKVLTNLTRLEAYLASMQCAINKAQNGSDVEDMYFLEKLTKMAHCLGFDLKEQS